MPAHITIEGFRKARGRFNRDAVNKAAFYAILRTVTSTKAVWARAMSKDVNLSIGNIKKAIYSRSGGGRSLSTSIVTDSHRSPSLKVHPQSRLRSMPLIIFNPRQTKTGVRARPLKNKPALSIRSAFIPKNARPNVYKRVGKSRLPIKALHTSSLEQIALDNIDTPKQKAAETLQREFQRQLRHFLSKR